jgi:hypothetical protein
MKCQTCQKKLCGRQQKWCSLKCKHQSDNAKHKTYECQRNRGNERKRMFIERHGGKCEACGYDKNYAALTFHHMDPSEKRSGLTIRHMANNSMEFIEREISKCKLLCYNCHVEVHHPELMKVPRVPQVPLE